MERLMRNVVRGGVMVLCVVGLTGCFSTYTWHQKMTVEVEADGQLYAGSSVVQVSATQNPDFLPVSNARDVDFRGEAVVLKLPENQYLFTLLTNAINLAPKVFEAELRKARKEPGQWWLQVLSDLRKTRNIAPKDYPLLVTFTDITDPKTVQEVDPENLNVMFGPGVWLKRITLEITDEPVTEGKIESVLGWWCDLRKKRARLNGSTSIGISDNELSNNLGTGSFRIGDCT